MGRSAFGEQIAVLDGFEEGSSSIDYDTSEMDGRVGQARADAMYRSEVTARGPSGITATRRRMNVLDASAGANYSGGSSFAPGLPLLPSNVGLAAIPGVLPERFNVINPSQGANYSGGSSWTGGMPLVSSNSGLASPLVSGGYGREGLGRMRRGSRGFAANEGYGRAGLGANEGYGRAGLGQPMAGADNDLCGAFASIELGRLDPSDGRLGQERARVDQYARLVAPNVLVKTNVIDPSGGANYSGGSSWTGGIPLISSNAGLAGLDAMGNKSLRTAIAKIKRSGGFVNADTAVETVGKNALDRLKAHALQVQRVWSRLSPMQKAQGRAILRALGIVRLARANIIRASAQAA